MQQSKKAKAKYNHAPGEGKIHKVFKKARVKKKVSRTKAKSKNK